MSIETEIAALTQATNNLTNTVNVRKADLDQAIIDAEQVSQEILSEAVTMGNAKVFKTWAQLSAHTGMVSGDAAIVMNDTGTHTDPVVGGAVSNTGVFRYTTGWERISELQGNMATLAAQSIIDALPLIELDDATRKPLIKDDAGNVILWVEDGGVSFTEFGATGSVALTNALAPYGAVPNQISTDNVISPLVIDDQGNVPLWLENGGLSCTELSKTMVAQIRDKVQGRAYGYGRNIPVATDGRSLFRYRAKLARLKNGEIIRPTVLLLGDSYLELAALPQAISSSLYTQHGKASDGWLSSHHPNSINGIVRTTVGTWTNYDASDGIAPLYGCGIDGKSTSTTGTTQRELLTNVVCTEFTIYYHDGNGTFQYGVYNGASVDTWNTVVCTGTNTTQSITISGLTDAPHLFELRTVGNTGTVAIHGYRATRNSSAGIIVDKCGNAGAVSNNLVMNIDQLVNYQSMEPDVIMLALGTNNASVQSTSKQFETDLPNLITAWRARWPTVGIVLIAQPLCTGVKQSQLIDFRDAAYETALAMNCDFYSMYDDWSSFDNMNALGMFLEDGIHPSIAGSTYTASRLTQLMGL